MIDQLLTLGLSNLCIALAIAALAWTVQTKTKRPGVAHLLWLLVLVKLLTPALFTLPVVALPGAFVSSAAGVASELALPAGEAPALNGATPFGLPNAADAASAWAPWMETGKLAFILVWLVGSLLTLGWSLLRIYRFNHLLRMGSHSAPPELQAHSNSLALVFGLKTAPEVRVTSAHLSPMLWWVGGRVRVFLPATLLASMGAQELRWVMAHELAHVKRRDHLVRWVEWLACVAFWWNPLTWMARRNLRMNEEICCDALVLSTFRPNPRNYANSLLNVLEFLASPGLRPPAIASQINGGGHIEKRIKMIMSRSPLSNTPHWLNATLMAGALCLLPLGVAYAQDPDFEAVSSRPLKAVQAGEFNESQAKAMIGTLAEESMAGRLKQAQQRSESKPKEDSKRTPKVQRPGSRIQMAFKKLGVPEESLGRIKKHLQDSGLKAEQIEGALGAMLRILYAQKQEGAAKTANPRLVSHLKDQGLSEDQIKIVYGLANRLQKGASEPAGDLKSKYLIFREQMREAVQAGELTPAQGQAKLSKLRKKMGSSQQKVEASGPTERLRRTRQNRDSADRQEPQVPTRSNTKRSSERERRGRESRARSDD
jgi:beta-lactamase regulating signal transducer with metallopeptidase domain